MSRELIGSAVRFERYSGVSRAWRIEGSDYQKEFQISEVGQS